MSDMNCYFCGGDLIWDSDSNANEIGTNYDDTDPATVSFYTCSKCGRSYEIYEPSMEEKRVDYNDFWKESL